MNSTSSLSSCSVSREREEVSGGVRRELGEANSFSSPRPRLWSSSGCKFAESSPSVEVVAVRAGILSSDAEDFSSSSTTHPRRR